MKIIIEYPVTTSFTITIERDSMPENVSDLLESVTREELYNAPMSVNDIEWGHIKYAWLNANPEDVLLMDEDGDIL